MTPLKVLYLIEGLDCSGKKTTAKQVESWFKEQGYSVRICIGPLFAPLERLDDFLVSLTYRRTPRLLLKLRKKLYLHAPILDAELWRPDRDADIVLKVSSSYRTWGRAVVEGDTAMSSFFEKHRRSLVRYSGAVILEASFDERLKRHRKMFASGLTQKTEGKRFLEGDETLFGRWNGVMIDLMRRDIQNILVIDTTGADGDLISHQIIEEIGKLLCTAL